MAALSSNRRSCRGSCACCFPEDEELRAWYMYDFGIGPIALAIIVFAPLLVVTQAKYEASKGGVIEWRHITSDGDLCAAPVTVHSDADFRRPDNITDDCQWFPLDTKVPGIGMDYTSVAAYVSALVLFSSGALLVILGPMGDIGSHRRLTLAFCVGVWGVCFAIPVSLSSSSLYLVNALFVFAGATAWNFGNRALRNAYLPLLVRSDPKVQEKMKELYSQAEEVDDQDGARCDDNRQRNSKMEVNKLSEQLASEFSITTSAYFFVGQILGFIVQGLLVTLLAPGETEPSNTFGLRLALAFAAVFGIAFCWHSIYGLGVRPGPPFAGGTLDWLSLGCKRVYGTLTLMRKDMSQMMVFLIGRTLHWTAVQSILTTATLYIEREFSLRADELVLPLVVMLVTSMISALALGAFVKRYKNSNQRLTLVVCCVTNLIPVYMLLGLREKWEIYFLFVLAGLLVSPFPALSRGILAQMIPAGYSSTIMSLEGILELGTSWIGPLVIGLIVDLTGSIRWGCFSMLFVMLPALPFLFKTSLAVASDQKMDVEKMKVSQPPTADLEMFQLVPEEAMNE
ncbi:MFS domain-containing protein [Chloropicon primus]|uniref:Major facilitator superfamily (MFS) profile domain-containing protein n=1 Tax=Chloropicon primus TaxID=1764295 RepID=A0A5B8MM85_9CHLO|nr:hypothetical protein A3770_06p41210 [Chloropicon primus]UPR00814.1 MFS domain-containing protein [Chloropicon primus]|eukprot:QDZ21603.1 hypothetical protein A3770_06p41210 [Chloropicon primus]